MVEGLAVSANLGTSFFDGTGVANAISAGPPPLTSTGSASCSWWNVVCQVSTTSQYLGYIAGVIVYYATMIFSLFIIPVKAIALVGAISLQYPLLGFCNGLLVIFMLYGLVHSPT